MKDPGLYAVVPICQQCSKSPAVCVGRYEGGDHRPNEVEYACGECCGHGNEDGHCRPIDHRDALPIDPRGERCGRYYSRPPMRAVTCQCEMWKKHGGKMHLGRDRNGAVVTWEDP